MIDTISYSPGARGWNSRHTWYPEWMIGMNSTLFTFKNGDLYKHDANANYNEFYGESTDEPLDRHPTSVTFPFNDAPDEEKVFKTISLDSNVPWITDVTTELSNGTIDDDWYTLKEGEYYSWIRRDANDLDPENLSLQGIGTVTTYAALVLTFNFTITSSVNTGDKLYIMDTGTGALSLIGSVVSKTATTVTVDAAANTPTDGVSFIVVVKDSTAESRGARGSYMTTELKIYKSTSAELFGVGSEVFKSNP